MQFVIQSRSPYSVFHRQSLSSVQQTPKITWIFPWNIPSSVIYRPVSHAAPLTRLSDVTCATLSSLLRLLAFLMFNFSLFVSFGILEAQKSFLLLCLLLLEEAILPLLLLFFLPRGCLGFLSTCRFHQFICKLTGVEGKPATNLQLPPLRRAE